MYKHAKTRLLERFGISRIPEGKRVFVASQSNNRKIYRIGDVFFVWRKSDKKVITFLTKEQVKKQAGVTI
jgi:uncharacterized protein YlbG (UPF0298 family)